MAKPSIAQTDVTGQRFGQLVAVSRAVQYRWRCMCDCGREVEPLIYDLLNGHTRSCGCLHRETCRANGLARLRHGDCVGLRQGGKLPSEYHSWVEMIRRCGDPNRINFADYGGREITVCARWRDDYQAFLTDMGRKPTPTHTIERVENSLGYEPGNCVWATPTEQANNRRSNVILEWDGREMTAAQWARHLGFPPQTLRRRILEGWTVERALTTPLRTTGRH